MQIVCPTCNATYRLPDDKLPPRRMAARCKRCSAQIIIAPGPAPTEAAIEPPPPSEASPGTAGRRPEMEPRADLIAFVGPNGDRYLPKFKKFDARGGRRFVVTWHWPAALIGVWWLLYRKLYLWALVAFVVSFIPIINVASIFVFGIIGNYIYYRHALKKVAALRAALPDDDLTITLKQLGGVNRWVAIVGIALGVVTAVGVLAAIIVPLVMEG